MGEQVVRVYGRPVVRHVPDEQPDVDSRRAAFMLGVSEANLRQMVRRGYIAPTGRRDKRSLFSVRDLEALAERRGVSLVTDAVAGYDAPKPTGEHGA